MNDLAEQIWNIVEPMLTPSCDCWRYTMIEKTPAGGFYGYVRATKGQHAGEKWSFHWQYCPICGKESEKP